MKQKKNRYHSFINQKERGVKPTKLSFYRQRRTSINFPLLRDVAVWVGEILLVIALTAVVAYFFGFRVPVPGQSMMPTLENGEQVLVNRFYPNLFQPRSNDLVVYSTGRNEALNFHIKRVIGVPGDTVQIRGGVVYVNDEPFAEKERFDEIENALLAAEAVRVGTNEFFVLGDNRNNSEDSRYASIGNVSRENIRGKVWFRILPLRRFGFVR